MGTTWVGDPENLTWGSAPSRTVRRMIGYLANSLIILAM